MRFFMFDTPTGKPIKPAGVGRLGVLDASIRISYSALSAAIIRTEAPRNGPVTWEVAYTDSKGVAQTDWFTAWPEDMFLKLDQPDHL